MKHTAISRRGFLRATPTALALVAAGPVGYTSAAAIDDALRPEVQRAAEAFADIHIAHTRLEREAQDKRRALYKALNNAKLRVPTTLSIGLPSYLPVNDDNPPNVIRIELNRIFDQRIAGARNRAAEGGPMKRLLPTEAQIRADKALVMRRARSVFRRYERIRAASGEAAAWQAEGAAYSDRAGAVRALIATAPSTIEEVRAVASALVRAGETTERWYDLPFRELALSLAGRAEARSE